MISTAVFSKKARQADPTFQRIKSPNLKSQGVSPLEFLSGNHLPKSEIAVGAAGCPLKICSENQVPRSQIARGVPLSFFRESSPQISNGKGCPPKFFSRESQVPKSQIARGGPPSFFRALRFRLDYTRGVLRSFLILAAHFLQIPFPEYMVVVFTTLSGSSFSQGLSLKPRMSGSQLRVSLKSRRRGSR